MNLTEREKLILSKLFDLAEDDLFYTELSRLNPKVEKYELVIIQKKLKLDGD